MCGCDQTREPRSFLSVYVVGTWSADREVAFRAIGAFPSAGQLWAVGDGNHRRRASAYIPCMPGWPVRVYVSAGGSAYHASAVCPLLRAGQRKGRERGYVVRKVRCVVLGEVRDRRRLDSTTTAKPCHAAGWRGPGNHACSTWWTPVCDTSHVAALDQAIDELFVAQPEEFTEARNNLATQLKAGGDAEGAAHVMSLRRPTRSAWALNRLVRDDRAGVEELLSVGDRLRSAQVKALTRKGAPGLREASIERDRLVSQLARRAGKTLGDQPPAALLDEIAATLESASVNESAARDLLEARLSKPLPRPTGFGDVLGLRVVEEATAEDRSSSTGMHRSAAVRNREIRAAERRAQTAKSRVTRLREELSSLRVRVSEREQQLKAAEAEARGAAAALKRLRR
jgi:hypothetical protein